MYFHLVFFSFFSKEKTKDFEVYRWNKNGEKKQKKRKENGKIFWKVAFMALRFVT